MPVVQDVRLLQEPAKNAKASVVHGWCASPGCGHQTARNNGFDLLRDPGLKRQTPNALLVAAVT